MRRRKNFQRTTDIQEEYETIPQEQDLVWINIVRTNPQTRKPHYVISIGPTNRRVAQKYVDMTKDVVISECDLSYAGFDDLGESIWEEYDADCVTYRPNHVEVRDFRHDDGWGPVEGFKVVESERGTILSCFYSTRGKSIHKEPWSGSRDLEMYKLFNIYWNPVYTAFDFTYRLV
jgi:hypothetical protein